MEEEQRWCELVRELDALGRIYYRRRISNEGKKSGNMRDFLNTWGRRYRYFIVFDADSVMRGETMVDLVKLMEAHPQVGLIQTVPALVNAESLFGRIQQFANRLYAPDLHRGTELLGAGFRKLLGAQRDHPHRAVHAVLRPAAFAGPQTVRRPDPEPRFCGGRAVAARKTGRSGSPTISKAATRKRRRTSISNAQRDRRWCQGNLQHALVLFARGLRGISRMHLLLGIFGYLASPLWLLFLITFNWTLWNLKSSELSVITVRGMTTPFLKLSGKEHAFLIFVICMSVLFLPKVLALIDLAFDRERRKLFGGLQRATVSAVLETIFSSLHAPLQMLWHSKFVVTILLGIGVHWGPQKRTRRRHPVVGSDSAALGPHVDRHCVGRGGVEAGPGDVLVVPAGARGNVAGDSVERFHQPHRVWARARAAWDYF